LPSHLATGDSPSSSHNKPGEAPAFLALSAAMSVPRPASPSCLMLHCIPSPPKFKAPSFPSPILLFSFFFFLFRGCQFFFGISPFFLRISPVWLDLTRLPFDQVGPPPKANAGAPRLFFLGHSHTLPQPNYGYHPPRPSRYPFHFRKEAGAFFKTPEDPSGDAMALLSERGEPFKRNFNLLPFPDSR